MVYATCSILPSENTLQTKNFIEKNPEYELIGEEKLCLARVTMVSIWH